MIMIMIMMIMIIIIMIKKKLAFCAKAEILQSFVSTSGSSLRADDN